MPLRFITVAVLGMLFALLPATAGAQATTPPEVFDPTQVRALNLEMDPADWDTIRRDTTNEIEVPARFREGDGESAEPILVSVRRKSSRALPSEAEPQKVGLKVDINEFVSNQTWAGLAKLSLENGADTDPVAEGTAWNLHEMASGEGLYHPNYHPGRAAWVKVTVNGQPLGVYVNVEQRDTQLLRNRQLIGSTTPMSTPYRWLYEIDDINGFEFERGGPDHSPTFTELCYPPFGPAPTKNGSGCKTPSDSVLAQRLPQVIDMPAMLTQGAVDAFSSNNDALFSHGKNYFFADSNDPLVRKRVYIPWDLDAAIRDAGANIYGTAKGKRVEQTGFQSMLLNHPVFRQQYNDILLRLTGTGGALSAANLTEFIDGVQPALAQPLADDPYMPIDSAARMAELKRWASQRIDNVRAQVAANQPQPRR